MSGARLRLDEAVHVLLLVAGPNYRPDRLTAPRPHPAQAQLQPDAVFVHRPALGRRRWVHLLDGGGEGLGKAVCAAASAAAWWGRGVNRTRRRNTQPR